ncbi:hypothetical protein CRUP_020458 [Coryphaenoides rupestris]|nr:hypothetical protein CRUP_020458 [Coryphaenoides rupestris]
MLLALTSLSKEKTPS